MIADQPLNSGPSSVNSKQGPKRKNIGNSPSRNCMIGNEFSTLAAMIDTKGELTGFQNVLSVPIFAK